MQKPKEGADQLEEFGQRVRQFRTELKDQNGKALSQEDLAHLCHLHRTYIGHVERGEVNVALVNVLKIAKALEVNPALLVDGLSL